MDIKEIIENLVNRSKACTEATIQSDIRQLLLESPFDLSDNHLRDVVLESPVGDKRRIDIEIGAAVIEVKRDLAVGNVRDEAIDQLCGYVETRQSQTATRYVGILTDGIEWRCYHLGDVGLQEVSKFKLTKKNPDVDGILVWLEGVLATAKSVPATPIEIKRRLGASSSSYALDYKSLKALYDKHKDNPSVEMKRLLWSRLLSSAFGTQFTDNDDLFLEHTLLVNSAEIIAHCVLGVDVKNMGPVSLLTGAKFEESGIFGVVEADFFDWVVEVDGGDIYVNSLAKRLARFDWGEVENDVLKELYESIISTETRKNLGEYYTPDWLAETIVETTISSPLEQRVFDPACGSGTFLFFSVRRFIKEAEKTNKPIYEILSEVSEKIIGIDLHPVAVIFARVTYLLAIGRKRLTDPERKSIHVPVYLGDSMQWMQDKEDMFRKDELIIETDDQHQLFNSVLKFPNELLGDAKKFDQLVKELANLASNRAPTDKVPSLSAAFRRLAIPSHTHATIEDTFKVMCELHDDGRDHIWGYYVRNLARPIWLSKINNRVDVLIGNPPWLAYRHMSPSMQDQFKKMSEDRGLWHGAKNATHQDLSALFVARAIQLYLKSGGKFALVMPNAVIDRAQYSGFRTGNFEDIVESVCLKFNIPWDLRRIRPHFFPRGSSVISGERATRASCMLDEVELWEGTLPKNSNRWIDVKEFIECKNTKVNISSNDDEYLSPYRLRFSQGATVVPRFLYVVEKIDSGPLGVSAGRVNVKSSRSSNEKKPWKELADYEGVVETDFIRPLYSGDNLIPFLILPPFNMVAPIDKDGLIDEGSNRSEFYPGLSDWMKYANKCWLDNRSSKNLSLSERLNYQKGLSNQFPIQELRIVYNKSGMHLVAAILNDPRGVINSGLYWSALQSYEEGQYLCAVMNAPCVTELLRPLMSYGKDERDIHKHIWKLPIPEYDANNSIHQALVELSSKAEKLVSEFEIDNKKHFSAIRRKVRESLDKSPIGSEINDLVFELIS